MLKIFLLTNIYVHRRIIIMQSVFALLTSSKSEKFYYGNICVAQWSVIVRVISLFGQHDIVLANSKLLSQYKCHGEAQVLQHHLETLSHSGWL